MPIFPCRLFGLPWPPPLPPLPPPPCAYLLPPLPPPPCAYLLPPFMPMAPQPAPQPVAPQPAPQPVAPQPAPQPVAPQPAPQPVAPQPAPQPVAPQPAPQPVAPHPAPQPVAPHPAPQPVAPQPAPQPVAPQPAPQPVAPQPAPQPSYIPPSQPQPCSDPIEWVPATGFSAPELVQQAFVAGEEGCDGSPLCVIRAHHNGDLVPGKLAIRQGSAYVPYGGKEVSVNNFEVLCVPEHMVRWETASQGSVPPNAIIAGNTHNAEPLYICRVKHLNSITPGKVHPSHGCAFISIGGSEHRYMHYEVLCKN